MFQGEYQHGLDAKGRLILPAKIREDLGPKFVLTRGMDGCLYIFAPADWQTFSEKLGGMSSLSDNARRLQRYFIGGSVECEPDKQGRFLIPPALRKAADIEKEVTVLGVWDRIEIWATEKYEEYLANGTPIETAAADLNQ